MKSSWSCLLTALAAALIVAAPACTTKLRCYEHWHCDPGQRCEFETEKCVDDPCYGYSEGHFLRCEDGAAMRCDAEGLVAPEDCGALGCNEAEQRCNSCVPGTSSCAGDTWILCDAEGLVEAEEACLAGCAPTGCLPTCGDGRLDLGEVCDDGNTDAGDGCAADCLSDETCGNGIVDTAVGEECDDGNDTGWDGCTACAITEFQVNDFAYGYQTGPSIAIDGVGTATVVWTSDSEDGVGWGYGVWGRRLGADGQFLGSDFQVSDVINGNQTSSVVAATPDGRFVVAYLHLQGTIQEEVRVRLFGTDGTPSGNSVLVSSSDTCMRRDSTPWATPSGWCASCC